MSWVFIILALLVIVLAITALLKGEKKDQQLSRDSDQSAKEQADDSVGKLTLGQKLILGAAMAHKMEEEEKRYQARKREREQKYRDMWQWQDTVRDKDDDKPDAF
jgi:hypothetical protein